jgi:uncharacterized membrane protein YfcA
MLFEHRRADTKHISRLAVTIDNLIRLVGINGTENKATMTLQWETVAIAALIVMFGYTVFGLTGFGSSITAVPILVHVIPLKVVVPTMLLLDLGASTLLVMKSYRSTDRKELLRLVPFMLVGMAAGVSLLVNAPERILLLVLGIFVLSYSAWSLLLRHEWAPIRTAWSAPLGMIGGVFTALFGTGGPIYAIYLARRLNDKITLRATNGSLILCSALGRLLLFTGAGLYTGNAVFKLAAFLLPCSLLGFYLGTHLQPRLSTKQVVQLVWAVLIVGGVSLIARSL